MGLGRRGASLIYKGDTVWWTLEDFGICKPANMVVFVSYLNILMKGWTWEVMSLAYLDFGVREYTISAGFVAARCVSAHMGKGRVVGGCAAPR